MENSKKTKFEIVEGNRVNKDLEIAQYLYRTRFNYGQNNDPVKNFETQLINLKNQLLSLRAQPKEVHRSFLFQFNGNFFALDLALGQMIMPNETMPLKIFLQRLENIQRALSQFEQKTGK